MTCLRLLSLSGLLYAILACPAQAQVLTGGPYRVGDTILHNGVAEKVVAGPFFENHARSQPVPAYPPVPSHRPPYQPLPPIPYQLAPQHPAPPQPLPAQPTASDDDDSDPNCCLRPGSELWEQMVDLIRENARLEATVGKLEEVSELRLALATEQTEELKLELRQAEQRLQTAEQASQARRHEQAEMNRQASQIGKKEKPFVETVRSLETANQALKLRLEQVEKQRMEDAKLNKAVEQQVEKRKAQLQQLKNETSEKMEAAIERTADLEKQLSTTKHHLDEAREREQAWSKERQKLQREISELKKRRQ